MPTERPRYRGPSIPLTVLGASISVNAASQNPEKANLILTTTAIGIAALAALTIMSRFRARRREVKNNV